MGKKIYEWDTTPADNDFVPADGGWPEGMLRSEVNNASRENLADLRDWHDDMEWQVVRIQGPDANDIGIFTRNSNTEFQIQMLSGQDLRDFFPDGRLLRFENAGSQVGAITQCVGTPTFSVDTTTVTTTNSTPKFINGSATDVKVYFSKSAKTLALADQESFFFVPETNDSEGLQAAIDAANAAGGGTVLLTASSYNITTTIDMTSLTSNVKILGAVNEATLLQPNTTNLVGPLVDVSSGSRLFSFENVRFNVNRTNNGSGGGTAVDVADNINLTFIDCQFLDAVIGVNFSTAAGTRISFDRCKFVNIRNYGVITAVGATAGHRGMITNCLFDGGGFAISRAAAVKVSGEWNIIGNRFLNCGNGTLTTNAIWLWNETTGGLGGRESTVIGNHVDTSNGVFGYGVEVGGDELTIAGNVIRAGTSGICLFVNAAGTGTTNQYVAITGNTLRSGQSCITVTDRARDVVISGNNFAPSNNGCIIQGDDVSLSGNRFAGGVRAIAVNTTGSNVTIHDNTMRDQTSSGILIDGVTDVSVKSNDIDVTGAIGVNITGTVTGIHVESNRIDNATTAIQIAAGSTGTILLSNETIGSTADLSDSGAGTNRWLNSFDDNDVTYFDPIDNGVSYVGGSLQTYGTTGCDLPCGGNAGRYMLRVEYEEAAPTPWSIADVGFVIGPNGTTADPFTIAHSITGSYMIAGFAYELEFVVSNGDTRFAAATQYGGGSNGSGSALRRLITTSCRKLGLE